MYIPEILAAKDKGVSFEFFPPKTEKTREKFNNTLDVLSRFEPLYVSMTCGAAGSTQSFTKDAVDILLKYKDLTVMPHITCIDALEESITQILDYYKSRSINNVMLLRGDIPCDREYFNIEDMVFPHASDLIKFVRDRYDFSVGAAVYPEGHIESISLEDDLAGTLLKIEHGVDFAVTQMFFDNSLFYKFCDKLRKNKVTIPILPGIFPLTDIVKLSNFTTMVKTSIPSWIEEKMLKYANSPDDMRKAGIEITIKQCRDLTANGVKFLHFFTFNNTEVMV
ncbi:MAG: methylenetetrahydrofolate reductase, partial [Candidatus Omnitrophota bacterium]